MKKKLILSLLLLPLLIKGQFTFQKRYDVNQNETAGQAEQTTGNEYLLTGYSFTNTLLLKVDSGGSIILAHKYILSDPSTGSIIHQTTDGGNIICGDYRPMSTGRIITFLLKTDAGGNVQWARQYSINQIDVIPMGFVETGTGDFVVCGRLESTYSTFIFRTDSLGNLKWGKECASQGMGSIIPSDLILLQNGNILVFGTESPSHSEIYLAEINHVGTVVREKIFRNSSYNQESGHIIQTNDGGFVFTGQIYLNSSYSHMLLAKIDSAFNLQWVKKYDGIKSYYSFGLTQAPDGGYVFSGILYDSLAHDTAFIAKTDGGGNVSWSNKFDFSGLHVYLNQINTNDHGFALTGIIIPSQLNYQAIFLKIDSMGNSNCFDIPFVSTAYNSGFTPNTTYLTFSNINFTETNLVVTSSSTTIFERVECSSLGAGELKDVSGIKVFPNPATSTISLIFQNTLNENATFKISNDMGQVVMEKIITTIDQTLDLSSLARGIYLMSIVNKQEIFNQWIAKD